MGFHLGWCRKTGAPKWFITGPGEIACVAGSRGIPEMDPNGSAMGNPREWLDELGKRSPKKSTQGPKKWVHIINDIYIYVLYIFLQYLYRYNMDIT